MNNFDQHWNENLSAEIPRTKKREAQRFLQPLFDYQGLRGPLRVLDAGCGDGVHVEVITDNADGIGDSSFVGIDISMPALRASRRRGRNKWAFLQSEVGRLPFRNDQFDVVYSFGVLAYTDAPFLSFSELCRVTRPGGYIGIWVYPKTRGVRGALFSLVREVCQVIGPVGCRLIADCIVPFLGFLPTRSKISLVNASWRQCREVVLVNIALKQLYFPDQTEIESWFAKNNIKIMNRDTESPVRLWGEKC